VDNSDLYQAEAAVKLREIELEKAEKMLISSARHFNNLRGIQSDVVSEKLFTQELPMKDLLVNSAKAKISRERELGKVVSEIQEQTFITMRELSLPQMSLDFAGQWNGRDKEFQEAQTESMEGDQPYWYVGFQLSIPLDIPKYYRLSRGYSSLIESEKLHLSSLNRDQDAEWKSFVERGSRLYKQVSLFRQLEEIQKRKADAERTRLTNGRSTTFQVLSFEQDYIAAKSQRISSELEAWQYLKEIPLFN
jgi:hypothetical protein